jgi:hypothetical protein
MLYFETRVRTSLLGMHILEFLGMVGYSGFRVRPELAIGMGREPMGVQPLHGLFE